MARRTLNSRFARYARDASPDGGAGSGGGGAPPDPAAGSGGTGGGDGGSSGGDGGKNDPPEPTKLDITQDQLDAIIQDRIARERKKYEKDIEDAKKLAGKSETEKLQIERDKANQDLADYQKDAARKLAAAEAKSAAIVAGSKPERADAVAKNADLASSISDDNEVNPAKVLDAVKKVLQDYPEWKADAPKKSGGDLGDGQEPAATLDDFRKMNYSERVELYQKNAELYKRLADQELDDTYKAYG